jgi:hypothetical protein
MRQPMETAAELFPAFLSCIERKDFREALMFCAEIELAVKISLYDDDDNDENGYEDFNCDSYNYDDLDGNKKETETL